MIDFSAVKLNKIIVHKVGNKLREEGIKFSEHSLEIESQILEKLLLKYFLLPFAKSNSLSQFYHEDDLKFNEVYSYVVDIFEDISKIEESSKKIATQLYENSTHPKITKGEFYLIHLSGCVLGDEVLDAVGVFKTENKDTYLRVNETETNFEIDYESGININKLDKGCLVFNMEKEKGFVVSVIDNINKSGEAQYWKDNFLKIKLREDNYYYTQNYITACNNFVDKIADDIDVKEKVVVKSNALKYFSENEVFDIEEFEKEVIPRTELRNEFTEYLHELENKDDINFDSNFEISKSALKKERRRLKSVIKLDKNYDIYIRANHEEIEKGFDESKGKHYYKFYFAKEK